LHDLCGGGAGQPLRPDGDDDRGHLLALRARAGVAPGAARGADSERPPVRARVPVGALSGRGAGRAARGRRAGVARLSRPAGGSRLTAYVTGEVEEAGLRAFLKQRLPGHMVPTGWVFLDALPLTPNDKVDRRVLSRLEPAARRNGASKAPRTPLEETLAKIF